MKSRVILLIQFLLFFMSCSEPDLGKLEKSIAFCDESPSIFPDVNEFYCFSNSHELIESGYISNNHLVFEQKTLNEGNLERYRFWSIDGELMFDGYKSTSDSSFTYEGFPIGLIEYSPTVHQGDTMSVMIYIANPPDIEFYVDIYMSKSVYLKQREITYETGFMLQKNIVIPDTISGMIELTIEVREKNSRFETDDHTITIEVQEI